MNELKDKIVSYIERAQKDFGITLVTEDWGNKSTKCACPLGCVLLISDYDITDDPDQNAIDAGYILGVNSKWVNSFINGFDETYSVSDNEEAWKLGNEIRNATNPINYTDYFTNLDPMIIASMETK